MLERELQWERDLFFALNGSDSVFWDNFFWLCSSKWIWIPFYLCVLFVFIYRQKSKEILYVLLAVVVVILLSDQIASSVFKPIFHRFRPTHHPDFKNLVDIVSGYRGGRYGFISSHAANAFGFATFTALLFRNRLFSFTIFTFALLNAYSRVYLGVHFISDVVAGGLVGALIGFLIFRLYDLKKQKPVYAQRAIHRLCLFFWGYTLLILFFSAH
ncbi:phosphatase PAP2 family protein [Bacteroidia bacterium]|nr:phosphatase PAP2 family protein [Bacteroidia bacterium]